MRLKLVAAAFVALGVGGCYIVASPDGVALGLSVRPIYSSIAGTGIRVVTNASGDVFYYAGAYYRLSNGRWWRSPMWRSGWTPIVSVPNVFLRIPVTHPKYHVVRHHPLHPARPGRTVRPAPASRPSHPAVRAKVRKEVRETVRERADTRPAPARPPAERKEKIEKEKKEKDTGKRGGR